MDFPDKKYDVIYADPPWSYNNKSSRGGTDEHYETMPITDIQQLPISDIADDDCVLFMWATFPMLQEALSTIKAWGFTYKTAAFVWVKRNKKVPAGSGDLETGPARTPKFVCWLSKGIHRG